MKSTTSTYKSFPQMNQDYQGFSPEQSENRRPSASHPVKLRCSISFISGMLNPPACRLSLIIMILFAGLLLFTDNAQAQETTISSGIKYVSAELVYLSSGSRAGLTAGDTLSVFRKTAKIADIVIVHISESSASCQIIRSTQVPAAGDIARITRQPKMETIADKAVYDSTAGTETEKITARVKSGKTRISGNIGIQWYQYLDQSEYHLNFQQPTLRINFKARQLWNKPYNLFIRLRSRYNRRENSFSADVPQKEWRNRIYELYFSYDDSESPLNYRVGRLISSTYSGVGYIDGIQLQHNAGEHFRWGIFGGTQPQWQYADFQTSIQKYGLFSNFRKGDYSGSRFESTQAIVGEYHGATVSREFIYLQNSYYHSSRWNIFQIAEIDINRGWRKDRTNQTASITGLYISGYYSVSGWMSLNLNYDNRKNYYTYELRSIADSLFDSAFRQGLRTTANFTLFKNTRMSVNFGLRDRENDSQYSYSYGVNLIQNNLFLKGLMMNMRLNGFNNLYTIGYNPSLLLSKYFRGGHSFTAGYGNYLYTIDRTNTSRINHWARASTQVELPLRLYLSAQYEYNWGNDRKGHLILSELGFRF